VTRIRDLPGFVVDSVGEDGALAPGSLEALNQLSSLLEPVATGGRARLLRDAGTVFRYAPFYSRLAEFWGLPEIAVESVFAAAQRGAWQRSGLPGLSRIDVNAAPRLAGVSRRLLCFAPGTRFPAHRHLGPESVFVLEGSYRDESGRAFRAGDVQRMAPGSEHTLYVDPREPCVAAVVEAGIEFSSMPLRWLTRWFAKS
jgi:quercetin dioxygenase-like cupin family protein